MLPKCRASWASGERATEPNITDKKLHCFLLCITLSSHNITTRMFSVAFSETVHPRGRRSKQEMTRHVTKKVSKWIGRAWARCLSTTPTSKTLHSNSSVSTSTPLVVPFRAVRTAPDSFENLARGSNSSGDWSEYQKLFSLLDDLNDNVGYFDSPLCSSCSGGMHCIQRGSKYLWVPI